MSQILQHHVLHAASQFAMCDGHVFATSGSPTTALALFFFLPEFWVFLWPDTFNRPKLFGWRRKAGMLGKIQRCFGWEPVVCPVTLISLYLPPQPWLLHYFFPSRDIDCLQLLYPWSLLPPQIVVCWFGQGCRGEKAFLWRHVLLFSLFVQSHLSLQTTALSPLPLCSPA